MFVLFWKEDGASKKIPIEKHLAENGEKILRIYCDFLINSKLDCTFSAHANEPC